RLTQEELIKVAQTAARKLNMATGPIHVCIPLQGFSYPDREGLPHWEPESNQVFIDTLRECLNPSIPFQLIDAHINDEYFIEQVMEKFLSFMDEC
ncbi:MAG: UPF0261 family protein, partial [Desulforhopalus sp.]